MPGSMPAAGRRRRKEHLLRAVIASSDAIHRAARGRMDCFVRLPQVAPARHGAMRTRCREHAMPDAMEDALDRHQRQLRFRHFRCAAARRHHRPRLDKAVERWGEREALVSPSHDVRWTWKEFAERVDALAAGFLALGLERGERIGIWSLNRPEWTLTQFAAAKAGLILVTINPAYRLSELEFALAKVGCAAIVTATAFKTSNYMEMLNTLLPELAGSQPGELRAARLPQLRAVIQIGGPLCPGTIPFDEVAAHGRRAASRAARSARRDPAVRRCRQYPVHQRHHGLAEGRDADASQHPQQRLFRRPRHAADRAGPHLHPGAALSLLRHGDGQPRLRHARRDHGLSRRRL